MITSKTETLDRVVKARAILVLDHPFFGNLALRQELIIEEGLGTAATNGKQMFFDPKFVATLNDRELLFLVAHETMHPMFDHCYRRNGRNHRGWNIAGDIVINQHLVNEGIGKMPKVGILKPDIFNKADGLTDSVYVLLQKAGDDGSGKGDGSEHGEPLDDCRDGGDNPAEIAEAEAEMKVAVAQAAQAAKMMGKLSAGLEELVNQLLNPKVDWATVMRNFVQHARTDERTYARPARRFAAMGVYTPSITGHRLGRVAVGVDRSGSQTRELDQFAAEIRAMHEDLCPEAIDVIYFDSKVTNTETFGPDDTVILHPYGGGGTRFSPIFRWIEEQDEQPIVCVVLTDLECNDFGPMPDYPVLWVTTDKTAAPWGTVVKMN